MTKTKSATKTAHKKAIGKKLKAIIKDTPVKQVKHSSVKEKETTTIYPLQPTIPLHPLPGHTQPAAETVQETLSVWELSTKTEAKYLELLRTISKTDYAKGLVGNNYRLYGFLCDMLKDAIEEVEGIRERLKSQDLNQDDLKDVAKMLSEVKTIDQMVENAKTCVDDAVNAIDRYLEKHGKDNLASLVFTLLCNESNYNTAYNYLRFIQEIKKFLFDPTMGALFYQHSELKAKDVWSMLDRMQYFFEDADDPKAEAELDRLTLTQYIHTTKFSEVEDWTRYYSSLAK